MSLKADSSHPSRWTIVCSKASRNAPGAFSKAKEAYPDLYETYEFNCQPEWYATGASEAYDDPSDQDKLQRLSYDPELGEGESYEESLCADLDRLEVQEINSLVVPTEKLPEQRECAHREHSARDVAVRQRFRHR